MCPLNTRDKYRVENELLIDQHIIDKKAVRIWREKNGNSREDKSYPSRLQIVPITHVTERVLILIWNKRVTQFVNRILLHNSVLL